MGIKDSIGKGLTNFMYPYMKDYYKDKGEQMLKNGDDKELYELQEKYLWFLGNEDMLATFYQTKTVVGQTVDTKEEYYYNKVGAGIRAIHSGMPSLISYSKARLLLTGDVNYKVEVKDKESKDKTELLEDICYDNKLNAIIKQSVLTESWGKKFAWKISNDPEVSKYPIIEMYNPFNYEAIYKRNRLQKIIFKTEYIKGKEKFVLHEIYGKGYIDYELYQVKPAGMINVALTDLEETAELSRYDFKADIILANEKFLDKSDYCGITSEFDALDEAWSQFFDEIRNGRAETYVPENLMVEKTYNKFRKDYVVLGTDNRENGKNEISHNQPEIRSEEYGNTIAQLTSNILVNVGLSPYTVGIQDNVGANSSGESLTKREMTSLRTREDMVKDWTEFLEETLINVLMAYDLFANKKAGIYDVDVDFGRYITPTQTEIIANTKLLKDSNIIDTEKALDEVFGDSIEEEEKLRIIANLGEVSFAETPETEE